MNPSNPNSAVGKRPKPFLRGVSHLLGALCAIPLAISLFRLQDGHSTATLVYGFSMFLLFAVSAFYHMPHWEPDMRAALRRVDRSMIYIFVAGTYTPILAGLGAYISGWVAPVVWVTAGLGVFLTVFVPGLPRVLVTGLYVALGWGAVMIMPAVMEHTGMQGFWFLTSGGIFYTVGAVAYAFRRPDPIPKIFGYHEIFHVCVLIAAYLHYLGVRQILSQPV